MIAEFARGLRKPPPTYILLVFLMVALPFCTGKLHTFRHAVRVRFYVAVSSPSLQQG